MNRKFVAGLVTGAAIGLAALAFPKADPTGLSDPDVVSAALAKGIHVRSLADVPRVRAEVIHDIFGGPLPTGFPASAVEVPALAPAVHAVQFPGDGAWLWSAHPNGKLAIYHAGHSQLALREGMDTVTRMLNAGYDVLALSMPAEPHDRFAKYPRPLQPFLEPVALALNYALAHRHYRDVLMSGLSGGGWTTVVYSAIDPRIRRSYPIAGSLPFYIRAVQKDAVGDYEQQLPGLSASYLDLYLLAASEGREQVQVFNLNDPCCFSGTAALGYRPALARRATALGGQFDVVVAVNNRHELPKGIAALMF